jgi:hypothetical protein
VRHGENEIAGSPQGSPPAADSVGCEAGRRTYSERETGTKELCDQVNQVGLHIVRSLVKNLKCDKASD